MVKLYKKKKGKKSETWSYAKGTEDLQEEITKLLKESGKEEIPSTDSGPSLLNKLFGIMSAGETAPFVHELVKTGSVGKVTEKQKEASLSRATGKGIGEHKTYSDVLQQFGMGENIGTKAAGLGLDILLDPTTYVGGTIAKGIGTGVKKVGGIGAKILRKVPAGAKALDTASDTGRGISKLFSPTARLASEGLSTSKAGEAYDIISGVTKEGRFKESVFKEGVEGLVKEGVSKHGMEAGTHLSSLLESGKGDEITDVVSKAFKDMWGVEFEKGLIKKKINDYIPHLLTDDARKFFETSGESFGIGTKFGPAKGRKLEGTISEINQSYRKYLKEAGAEPFDIFEEDLFKIFAKRGKVSIKALTMRGMVDDIVAKFGADPKNLKVLGNKIAMVDGVKYVPVPEDALRFFPAELANGNKLLAVTKTNRQFIPKSIADELVNMNKLLINDKATNKLLKVYDKAVSIWKGSVTGYFPAFHGKNALGGVFNNYIAGVKNPLRYGQANKLMAGSDDIIKLGGKEWTYKQLKNLMLERGAIGSQGYLDVFSDIQKTIKTVPDKGAKKILSKIPEVPQKTMNIVETQLRGALFIDRLKKGDNIGDAIKQVFKYHFDYAPEAFTPFERNVMKRLVPFFTWSRNNIPLQLTEMYRQPGKYANISKTLRTLEGDKKDVEHLPEYMQKGFPIKIGEKKGLSQYLYGMGLPVEDINKLGTSEFFSRISPPIKVPIELATGKHFYFDSKLEDVDTAPKMVKNAPAPIKKIFKSLVDYNEKTGKVNPQKWHILTSILGRGVYTVDKLTNPDVQGRIKALYLLLGIKGKEVDIKQQKYYRTKEKRDKVGEFLKKKGAVKKLERYYVPK